MKKIFTLLACAALGTSALFADIKIGETTYETLQAAVSAAVEGDVILVSGEVKAQSSKTRLQPVANNITIKGDGTAVVTCDQRGTQLILVNQNYTFNVENITFDGGNRIWDTTAVVSCEKGSVNFTDVVFKNFTVTLKNETDAKNPEKDAIIGSKSSLVALNISNVTFDNCNVGEGFAMVTSQANNALTITKNNPGISIYLSNNVAFKANELTNTTPIDVYLASGRAAGNVVTGYTDETKFNFIGMADGFGVEAENGNLVYQSVNYIATIGEKGYKSLLDALNAANVAGTHTINVLENCDLTNRFITVADAEIALEADNAITINRLYSNTGITMFEAKNSSASKLTFKNINITNTASNVTQSLLSAEKGTLTLENVVISNASTPATGNIQLKANSTLNLTNATVGSVQISQNNINIVLSGKASAEFDVTKEGMRAITASELANGSSIVLNFAEGLVPSLVNKVVVAGTDLDESMFTINLPEGYSSEVTDDGIKINGTLAVPEIVTTEGSLEVTINAPAGCVIWVKDVDNTAATPAAAPAFYVAHADAATADSEEISAANGWENTNKNVYTFTAEKSHDYAFATEANGQFSAITGISVNDEGQMTGVEDVLTDDANAPVEYYNLQGMRVANPQGGIFIRRQGNKVAKIAL